ncbi:unnamed protein product [Lasius platythorax]|uniref:CCHC-type domain-containing protein n=1 Tax=Lasius platythorax TaxID=488582 RepID=A0AAV2N054_9HYME
MGEVSACGCGCNCQEEKSPNRTLVRVEMLGAKPLQCFRCWGFGHVRFSCTSDIDRSHACFNCGTEGYSLKACVQPSRCVVCEAKGKKSNHRLGSVFCEADRRLKRSGSASVISPGRRTVGSTVAKIDAWDSAMQLKSLLGCSGFIRAAYSGLAGWVVRCSGTYSGINPLVRE